MVSTLLISCTEESWGLPVHWLPFKGVLEELSARTLAVEKGKLLLKVHMGFLTVIFSVGLSQTSIPLGKHLRLY